MKSKEDHGYVLDLGIPKTSGFLPGSDVPKDDSGQTSTLVIGQLTNVTVTKVKGSGKTCTVTPETRRFATSAVGTLACCFMPVFFNLDTVYGRGQFPSHTSRRFGPVSDHRRATFRRERSTPWSLRRKHRPVAHVTFDEVSSGQENQG